MPENTDMIQIFSSFKLMIEWLPLNKKGPARDSIKILSTFDIDQFGELNFHSYYNQKMFFKTYLEYRIRQKKHRLSSNNRKNEDSS
jgi:hypothetical protein